MISAHDKIVRDALARFCGKEIKSLMDRFLATFDGSGQALQSATNIADEVRALGIELRVGVHTGEVEMTDDDVHRIAVHIALRIMISAGPSEVHSSLTVKDLVAGSEIKFDSLGQTELAGIDEHMEIFKAHR